MRNLQGFLLAGFACSLILSGGCGSPAPPQEQSGKGSFERVTYSKLFGVLTRADSRQVFYINGRDTQWGPVFNKTAPPPSVAVLSTVFAGFFELLDMQACIVGIDNEKFYSDSVLLERFRHQQAVTVGEEGQVRIEQLLSARPDFLVSGSFGAGKDMEGRLEKLGIRLLYCENFKEQHPLARAEWIKFFGVVAGQFEKADSIFRQVEQNYKGIMAAADSSRNKASPKVMADAMFGDSWFVPGGNSFTASLIKDAGGDYIFADKVPLYSYPLGLEEVLMRGKDADIWIHTNHHYTLASLIRADKRYAYFRPFQQKNIFNNSRRENRYGGNDFWERGVGRPDLILSDLFHIFNGTAGKGEALNYYERLE